MCQSSSYRGHRIWFDGSQGAWRYESDGALVKENWEKTPCGKCGKHFTEKGHDPCIANLPGVMNACCGHGNAGEAYIQFSDGQIIRGDYALQRQKELTA